MNDKKVDTKKLQSDLMYKGKPLCRLNNIVYYGDPLGKYILRLTILQTKTEYNLDTADKVLVEILDVANFYSCKKKTEKDNLYHALDIGRIWLEKFLAE